MRGTNRTAALLAMMAGLAASLPGASVIARTADTPASTSTTQTSAPKQANRISVLDHQAVGLRSSYLRTRGGERRAGPGWTNRHVQRMARKKRNQARHRKASRG